jgi:hypothetical protein
VLQQGERNHSTRRHPNKTGPSRRTLQGQFADSTNLLRHSSTVSADFQRGSHDGSQAGPQCGERSAPWRSVPPRSRHPAGAGLGDIRSRNRGRATIDCHETRHTGGGLPETDDRNAIIIRRPERPGPASVAGQASRRQRRLSRMRAEWKTDGNRLHSRQRRVKPQPRIPREPGRAPCAPGKSAKRGKMLVCPALQEPGPGPTAADGPAVDDALTVDIGENEGRADSLTTSASSLI